MRDAAIDVLARFRVPELLAAADERQAELSALVRQLAAEPDAARAEQLRRQVELQRQQLEPARRGAEVALWLAGEELPPIEIAARTERVIARVVADPSLGRYTQDSDAVIADELEALADRVASIWVIGFDPMRFSAGVAQALAGAGPIPSAQAELRRNARLGWEPIQLDELVTRAALAIPGEAYRAACVRAQREASEHAAAAAALGEARLKSGVFDSLIPMLSGVSRGIDPLEQLVAKEHRELFAASEAAFHQIEHALTAFPPMAIYAAANAAAGVLRARIYVGEAALSATGVGLFPAAAPRGLLLMTLINLRTSVDQAFPGLVDLVSGRGGRSDAQALVRAQHGRSRSPYRERAPDTPESGPLQPPDTYAALREAIARTKPMPVMRRLLAHCLMSAGIERAMRRADARVDAADRLMFWSSSLPEQAIDQLAPRRQWHLGMVMLLMNQLTLSVDRAAQEQHLFRLRNAVAGCHTALSAIATQSPLQPDMRCGVSYREETVAALSSLAEELSRAWALPGTRAELVRDISAHLRTPAPTEPPASPGVQLRAPTYSELVTTLAESLRGTAFVGIEERLWHARQAQEQALAASRAAGAEVTGWDELNFLTDSPAEANRDEWESRAEAINATSRVDFEQADELLERALAIFPPAALYYRIGSLQAAVLAISAVLRVRRRKYGDTYYCVLQGKDRAQYLLNEWTAQALRVFGAMPNNGELLEWFVRRELGDLESELSLSPAPSLDA